MFTKKTEKSTTDKHYSIFSRIMILVVTLCSIFAMLNFTPVYAASKTNVTNANISLKAVTANATNGAMPSPASSVNGNSTLHINGQISSDLTAKVIGFEVMFPGSSSYTSAGQVTFNNFGRYADVVISVPNKSGTLRARVTFTFTNGTKKTVYTNTVTVTVNAVSTQAFNPSWPFTASNNYITCIYRYWNGGNVKNHGSRSNMYNSIDIAANTGTKVKAIEAGTVIENGYQKSGFGYYIVIEHANGMCSLYGHLQKKSGLALNAKVSKGAVIGYSGSTGNSTGPHLHLEVYNKKNYSAVINPFLNYFVKSGMKFIIGGNSYKANSKYAKTDSYAKAWISFLDTKCTKNASGDYVTK